MSNISPILTTEITDKAIWMGNNDGDFTVKTTWNMVRKKKA